MAKRADQVKAFVMYNPSTGEVFQGTSGKTVFSSKSAAKNSWNQWNRARNWYNKELRYITFDEQSDWELKEFTLDLVIE